MWEIKGKDNQLKATINSLEYNGEWMGESYVTVTVESPAPVNFEIGDYIIYRDERFEINYNPGKIKSAPRYEKGDAFKYENIKFNSLADELTRCDFLDIVLNDNQLHFTGLPKFSFYGGVKDLANRMQANLDRTYGKGTWSVVVSPEFHSTKEVNISVDTIKVQGALSILVNDLETYYTIKDRTITIGAAGIPAGHLFKYGKGNGLYEIEQNAEADQAIVTRLRAYGSTRNLPHRYYNSLSGADGKKLIPDNMAVQYLMLPEFPYTTQDPYIDSPNIAKLGVREDSVSFDGSGELEEIYPSIEGMTAEQLKAAGESCNSTGALDEIVSAEQMTDNGVGEINEGETQTTAKPPTFKVTLKDLGFNINDHKTTETATISFKTGMLGGRDFEIVGCKKIESGGKVTGYELELNRVYDDGIKLWFPYSAYNAKAGDKFVLLYIEMPEAYIKAAAQRLKEAATEWLSKNDYSRSIYAPKVDEIFMARQHDLAMASGGKIKSLHDTLKEGMLLLFEDEDLNIDASIFIDRLTIKEEGAVPTYEVVLKEEKTVGRLDKMQNQIDSLVAGKGQGGGGYTAAQIRSMIDAYGGTRFLSKIKDDRTPYKVSTDKAFEVGEFLSGVSGGIFGMDANTGDSFAEVARLYVRVKAFFEELTTVKASVLAGKQYITPGGGITCTEVEDTDTAYRCYFLSEQDGEKVETKIIAGDQAISEMFNAKTGTSNKVSNHRYWRLVTAVNNDAYTDDNGNHYGYIDLSKADCEANSDIPQADDEICQLGNRNDKTRQTAMVFSTVDTDAPSIKLFANIDSYTLTNRVIISFGRDPLTGQIFFRLGGADATQYLDYTQDKGLEIAGKLSIQSTIGNRPVGDYVSDAAKAEADRAKAELQANIDILQKQVDGVIESFNGLGAPTLGNYPANEWTTDEERRRHDRDIYTDITPYVDDATTPTSGQSWKWYYNSPTDYGWVKIADSDAVKALQLAAMSVRDTDVLYISHTSQTVAPALPTVGTDGAITSLNGWATAAPEWKANRYIWQTTYTRKGDGSAYFAGPTCIQGAVGERGQDGASYTANLFTGTRDFSGTWASRQVWGVSADKHLGFTVMEAVNQQYKRLYQPYTVEYSKTYTFSAWVKVKYTSGVITLRAAQSNHSNTTPVDRQITDIVKDGEWHHVAITFTATDPDDLMVHCGAEANQATNTIYVAGYKLEEGANANPEWTPAASEMLGTKGEDGNGIAGIDEYYATGNSGTVAPTSWMKNPGTVPAPSASAKYLWNYEDVKYTSGNAFSTKPHVVAMYSADGKSLSVKSTVSQWRADIQGVTPPATGWLGSIPTVAPGQYLWCKVTVTYTDGTTDYPSVTYSSTRQGEDGANYTPNLLKDSNREISRATYGMGYYDYEDGVPVTGKKYTLTLCYKVGEKDDSITPYWDQGWVPAARFTSKTETVESRLLTVPEKYQGHDFIYMAFYHTPNDGDYDPGSYVKWAVLTEGDTPQTAWIPAASEMTAPTIVSIETKYVKGANLTVQPTEAQFDASTLTQPGAVAKNQWLWSRTMTTWSDGQVNKSYTSSYAGNDGSTGAPGANGYTHIAYAKGITGSLPHPTGFAKFQTTAFDGAEYIGFCTDHTEDDPTDFTEYEWTKYVGEDGEDGRAFVGSTEYYLATTDGVNAPTGGWKTDFAQSGFSQTNKYLWNYEVSTYTKAPTSVQSTPRIIGVWGQSVTMTANQVHYSTVHNSAAQPADSTFTLTAAPTLAPGQYLWSRTTVSYSNGQSTKSYAVSRIGEDGQNGANYSENLVLKSNEEKTSSGYHVSYYDLSEELVEGKEYTVTIWGEPAPGHSFGIWSHSGSYMQLYNIPKIANGVYSGSFKFNVQGNDSQKKNGISIYSPPASNFGTSVIHKIKLEHGMNVSPEWTPAAEEMIGVTIARESVTYAKTTSTTQPADSAFTATSIGQLNLALGDYMWSKTEVTYTDGTVTKSYAVSRLGSDGDTAIAGLHVAYASAITGSLPHPTVVSGFSTTMFAGAKYIGIYKDNLEADSTDFRKYDWALFKGEDAAPAKVVNVTGEQVFTYKDDFATLVGPAGITLTASLQGTTGYQWSYKPEGATGYTNFISGTGSTIALNPGNTLLFPSGARRVVVRCTSGGVYDEVTVFKVSSGSRGAGYTNNLLKNSDFADGGRYYMLVDNTSVDTSMMLDGRASVKTNQSGLTAAAYRGWLYKPEGWNPTTGGTNMEAHPGEQITLSSWVRTDSLASLDANILLEIHWLDRNRSRISSSSLRCTPKAENTWEHFALTSKVAPEGTAEVELRGFVVKNGRAWFNGIKAEYGANDSPVWSPYAKGTDGSSVGINDTQVRYSTAYNSATQPADSTFTLTAVPSLSAGQYLWSRTMVTYSDGKSTKAYAVTRMGINGTNGTKGDKGDAGASYAANLFPSSYYNTTEAGAKLTAAGALGNRQGTLANFRFFLVDAYRPIKEAGYYSVSMWMKTTSGEATATVDINDHNAITSVKVNTSWQFYKGTVYVNNHIGVYGFLDIYISSGDYTTVRFSDVTVTPTETPLNTWVPTAEEMVAPVITGTETRYAKGNYPTQPADGLFTLTTPGTLTQGQWLWTRTVTNYSDNSSTKSYTVSYIGADGDDGIPGAPGANGQTSYVHFAYAKSITGSLPHPTALTGFSTTAFAGARYIGQCTDFNKADPTANPHTTYEWTEYVGASYTANLIPNSAFIKGLDRWSNWGAPNKREVVESDGKNWLHVVANAAMYQGVAQALVGKPNTEYTLSALVRGAAANQSFGFVVHGITGSSNTSAYYKEATVGTAAERVVLHFTSKATTERLRIMVGRNPAVVSDIYITDIKLEEGHNEQPVWNPMAEEMVAEDGYSIVLTNESHDFAGSETAAVAASTECGVIAYSGADLVAAHIGAITGMPTGMSVAISGNDTTAAKFTVSVTTVLTTLHGTLNVPVTVEGRAFTKKFSWTLARQGAAGKSVTISSTDVRYIQQESATRPADSAFNSAATTPPTAIAGQYLHSRTKVTYSDGNSTVTYSVSRNGADGTAWGNGKMLFNDPTFKEGLNSATVYDNNLSGKTTVERVADSTAPNDSGQILRVRNTGEGTSPRLGGFYQSTYSGASKEFILRYIMKIPVGYRAVHSNNAVGTGSEFKWLTPTAGTGKWEEYILRLRCGNTGTFSTFGYVCFDGTAGSASAPVDFLVAYATVFDMGGNGEFKIEKTDVRYILQASSAQPTDTAFDSAATAIPGTLTQGYYLWSRTKVTYSDGKSTSTYGVTRIGTDGANGIQGPVGPDGRTSYVHLVYADSVTGSLPHPTSVSGFSTTVKSTSKYIGTRTDFLEADTTANPQTYYEWSKYVGENGSSYSNNLLLGSKKGWENTGYPTATLKFGEERLAEGEEFTITMWGAQLGAGKTRFAVYNSGGWISPGNLTNMGGGVFMLKGRWQINGNGQHPADNTHINIYPIPNSASGVTSKIGRVKIERGHNDDPVWTPAAEDQLPPTITEQYYLSTSSTVLTGGAWSDTKQPWVAGRYYWTRSKLTYADGTLEYTEPICATGEPGTSVLAEYSADGTTWHSVYAEGDVWMHTSKDNGATWTPAVRIVGASYAANLFVGTRDFNGFAGLSQWVKESETRNGNAVYSRSGQWGGPYKTYTVKKGETYTFSADVKVVGKSSVSLYINVGGSTPDVVSPSGINIPVTEGVWTRVHRTFTIAADGVMHARAESSTATGTLYISSYKLESGENPAPVWTPAAEEMVGTDGQWRKFQWALGSATGVTGAWQDTPMNAPTGQYVWMRSGVVVPPATAPATWDTATRITGDKGQTGDSAYLLDLTTEHVSVFTTTDAAVAVSASSTARVLAGANIDSGWAFSGVFTGCSGTVNASTGAISVTQLAANANNATATVKATKSGHTTLQTTLRIDRIRKGDTGNTGPQGPAGTAAKVVVVNADAQAFTYINNFATLQGASTINLTATLQGTTGYQWSYKTPTQSAFTNISGATAATYALAHNASIWGTAKSITLRCTSGGAHDEVTIAKLSSGSNGSKGDKGDTGADAYTVLLTNESHTFSGGVSAAIAASTTCEVIAYKGNTRVAATIKSITGQLSGKLTTTVNNQGTPTANAKFTVIATSSLTEPNGVLKISVTVDGKTFTKEFSWSVSYKGQTGSTGAAAVVYSIEPNVDSVTRRADGTLSKSTVACTKYRTTGSSARTTTTTYDLYAQANTASTTGSWSLIAASGTSAGSIAIGPDTESVVFELRTSMDSVIAHERVPVITVASPSAIGTRNLALNSGGWNLPEGEFDISALAEWTYLNDGCVTRMSDGKLQLYKDAENTDGWWRFGLTEELSVGSFKAGTVLTLRVKGNVTGLTSGKYVDWMLFRTTDWAGVGFSRVSANGDFDLIKTITVPADYTRAVLAHRVANANAGTTLTIEHVGLYEGNTIPAEWTRAPEDTDYLARALQKATDDRTDMEGGLILAALMRLGLVDSAGARRIMAGLNGIYNPSAPGGGLAAFFGGDMVDPEDVNVSGTAAAAGIRMNGEAFFANNTLRLKEKHIEVGDYLHLQNDGMHMVIDGKETLRVGNAPIMVSSEALASTRRIVNMAKSVTLVSRKYGGAAATMPKAIVLSGAGFFIRHYAEGASSGSAISTPYALPVDSTIALNISASLLRTSRYHVGTLRVQLYRGTTTNNGEVVDYRDLPLQRKRGVNPETGIAVFDYWIDSTAQFTIGEAGSYYLYVQFIDEKGNGIVEDKNIPASVFVKGEIVMGASSGNVLGNNGLASIWGNNAALYMNQDAFLARIGNYGIHITGSGIRLRLGTAAWKTLGTSGSNLTLT